ncbi:MAG: hypothetical protein KKI09_05400 [Spirochaetes bacterium]|nr:hypothetical protein [Spirochaetota bacterium]MBU0954849.1 hypothetical protein [Spirochaetota bacterium]
MITGFLLILNGLAADAVRTNIAGVVTLSAERPEGTSLDIKYNDAVGIQLPADTLFIQAIEIELRIPRAFSGHESSVEWSLYSGADPVPAIGQLDYQAEQLAFQLLPSRVSLVLQVPIAADHTLRTSQFATLIPMIVLPQRFPLLFKLGPIGKGLAASIADQNFRLTIRPVLTDKGMLRIEHPLQDSAEASAIKVWVNDRLLADWTQPQLLARGVYSVRISMPDYRDEVYSAIIEAGKILVLTATPVSDAPSLSFQAPEGAVISLDGVVIDLATSESLIIDVGDHTVECTIGDYTVVRRFSAVRGKRYTILLTIDMEVLSE